MRVLIVEDNQEILGLMQQALSGHCEVVTAADGADALAEVAYAIKTEQFDVIVIDVAMQYVDGYALTKAIRCFESHELYPKKARLLYHTAHSDLVTNEQLLAKTGMSRADCFIKPDGTVRLLNELRGVRQSRHNEALIQTN